MTMVKFQVSSVLICNIHTSLKLQLIKYLSTYQCHTCGGGAANSDEKDWDWTYCMFPAVFYAV